MVRYKLLPTLRRLTPNWISSTQRSTDGQQPENSDRAGAGGDGGGSSNDLISVPTASPDHHDPGSDLTGDTEEEIADRASMRGKHPDFRRKSRCGDEETAVRMSPSARVSVIGKMGRKKLSVRMTSSSNNSTAAGDEADHVSNSPVQSSPSPAVIVLNEETKTGSGDEVSKSGVRLVIRTGTMKKKKTMRKKFFVLLKTEDGSVCLDYFDSEKKYTAATSASTGGHHRSKKTVSISDSFYIGQREWGNENNKQTMIDIFSGEICFTLIPENETDLKEWFEELRKQRNQCVRRSSVGRKHKDENHSLRDYHQVWQVSIAKKGLGLEPHNITGVHRLCLGHKMCYLFKVETATADPTLSRPLEFPLNSIRKCARSVTFFSLELGRGSTIGAGDLLMETEDASTARQMHDVFRLVMRQASESSAHRPRATSHSDGARNRRSTLAHINSTTPNTTTTTSIARSSSSAQSTSTPHPASDTARPYATSDGTSATMRIAAHNSTTSPAASNNSVYTADMGADDVSSAFRDRCDSEPAPQASTSRSRCTSEGATSQQLHYTTVSVANGGPSSGRLNSSSPPSGFHHHYHHHNHQSNSHVLHSAAVSPASANCSTESFGSLCHSEPYSETELGAHHTTGGKSGVLFSHREISCSIPHQPSILEQQEDSAEAYMTMDSPKAGTASAATYTFESVDDKSSTNASNSSYVMMSPVSGSSPASTSLMSPSAESADPYMDMGSSKPHSHESGYLSLVAATSVPTPAAGTLHSSSSLSTGVADEGYLLMAPAVAPANRTTLLSSAASATSHAATDSHHHNPHHQHHGSSHHQYTHHHSRPRHRSYRDSPPEPPRESLEKLAQEFPLQPVKSFFSPAEDPSDLIKPVRAYSIGSRPKPHPALLLRKDQDLSENNWYAAPDSASQQEAGISSPAVDSDDGKESANDAASRVRAFSAGSRLTSGATGGLMSLRISAQPMRKRATTQDSVTSSSSASNAIPEVSQETPSPPDT